MNEVFPIGDSLIASIDPIEQTDNQQFEQSENQLFGQEVNEYIFDNQLPVTTFSQVLDENYHRY